MTDIGALEVEVVLAKADAFLAVLNGDKEAEVAAMLRRAEAVLALIRALDSRMS